LAGMRQIARRNREALLDGRSGPQQEDLFAMQRSLDERRAQAEAEIVQYVLPRLAAILTREQIARAHLLALGEPVRDRDRVLGPALLDPAAGFVLAEAPPAPAEASETRQQRKEAL